MNVIDRKNSNSTLEQCLSPSTHLSLFWGNLDQDSQIWRKIKQIFLSISTPYTCTFELKCIVRHSGLKYFKIFHGPFTFQHYLCLHKETKIACKWTVFLVSRIGGNSFPFQQGKLSFFCEETHHYFFSNRFFFSNFFSRFFFFQTDLLKLILFLLLPIPSLEVRSLENKENYLLPLLVRSQDFVIIIFKKCNFSKLNQPLRSTCHACLMVNVIPCHTIFHSTGRGPTNSEYQFLVESFLE